jgi:hypothetical protein
LTCTDADLLIIARIPPEIKSNNYNIIAIASSIIHTIFNWLNIRITLYGQYF